MSAREPSNMNLDAGLIKSSTKKRTMKLGNGSEGSSIDLDGFDFKTNFDKTDTQNLSSISHKLSTLKNSTLDYDSIVKEKLMDYHHNQFGQRKVFSNNFFDKLKPIMNTWKQNPKFKKVETKDMATCTDNKINIQSDIEDYNPVTNFSRTPKSISMRTRSTQTSQNHEQLSKSDNTRFTTANENDMVQTKAPTPFSDVGCVNSTFKHIEPSFLHSRGIDSIMNMSGAMTNDRNMSAKDRPASVINKKSRFDFTRKSSNESISKNDPNLSRCECCYTPINKLEFL